MKLDREDYWLAVAGIMKDDGIFKANGLPLDWQTLEVSAEMRGFTRVNIPDPANMARNGLRAAFYPRED